MNDDILAESLGDLAESVRNVDLYDRALARSRRIGRNRALTGGAAALVALALAGGGLWTFPPRDRHAAPVVGAPTAATSTLAPTPSAPPASPSTPATGRSAAPPATGATTAVPRSRSLADLPGRVFYRSTENGTVVRLSADGGRDTVLNTPNEAVAISPDGKRIAYVANGRLLLAGSDQPVYDGTVATDQQDPAWSPDGTALLVGTPKPGILTVATGAFGPLPSSLGGQHFRWSGDGRRLIYGTASCRLKVAPAGGRTGTTVPVIGDPESARNPEQTAACLPSSADRAGGRVAVPLQSVGQSGYGDAADTVVDTRTGAILPLPVTGDVRAVLFATDGNLLIRTVDGDRFTLSVLAPDGTLLVQAREPAAMKSLEPVAYTR
jgi:TolB protein